MIRPEDIQARVRRQPFQPLRIVTSAGQTFDVYHPDLIMVGQRDLTIGTGSAESPTVYDRQTHVALMHVTALEDLSATAGGDGEGQT